jgi:hypothetical protein
MVKRNSSLPQVVIDDANVYFKAGQEGMAYWDKRSRERFGVSAANLPELFPELKVGR